ncbi:MAG: galactose-1-phosphate uridylyltransferase [Candidatus Bathyarchaeota archaeon]|nr:galactose-1-phosphate uridylyltransferase [Candidatus Bathyarchaeota archaeon]
MPYNELRKDYLLDRWVVIATERSRRPTDFAKPKPETAKTAICPLCVGNEHMTPPALMLYLKENGEIIKSQDPPVGERPKNWLIRDIPNLYSAFSPPKQSEDTKKILINEVFGYAVGHHEVLIESPNHDEDPADAKLPQLELLINAYVDRYRELSTKPYVKFISIFRNYGLDAGASLSHAHSQIIATPIVATTIQEEQKASKEYYDHHGSCFFCNLIKKEANGPRFVMENDHFLVTTPYASINPLEFHIIPKKHVQNISALTSSEIKGFAETLQASLKALKNLVNDPPYNYGFHQVIGNEAKDCYHWHLEVYPKLATWAGFEKSTGIYINTVQPEIAAESFRKIIH